MQVPNEQQDTRPIERKDTCMYIQGLSHTVSGSPWLLFPLSEKVRSLLGRQWNNAGLQLHNQGIGEKVREAGLKEKHRQQKHKAYYVMLTRKKDTGRFR